MAGLQLKDRINDIALRRQQNVKMLFFRYKSGS